VYEEVNLLNTIKVPRDLGQITERLPKPQYGQVMRRNKSLPPEKMDSIPDIQNKKDINALLGSKANETSATPVISSPV
jgi:hypothetical protein